MNVHLVSLGCARNLVDSEIMTGCLVQGGHLLTDDPLAAEIILINTCSFITSAAEESVDTILHYSAFKETGKCRFLIVAGCLPQRFKEPIAPELPEVDLFIGTGGYEHILEKLNELISLNAKTDDQTGFGICHLPDPNSVSPDKSDYDRIDTSEYITYIKVAEGCSRHCTYCIIPGLRGKYRSRSLEDILKEVEKMAQAGKKEILFVAESTTDYGRDLDGGDTVGIHTVLEKSAELVKDSRIRLLYTYPDTLTQETIDVINNSPRICSYFDIPIQHAADGILKKMGRGYTEESLRSLIQAIRKTIPDAAIRTTIITGFPGETETDFQTLLTFIKEMQFDHLGVFTYSDAEEQASHHLPNHVPEDVAQLRQDTIMATQAEISMQRNQSRIGSLCHVLIEENPEDDVYIGKSEFQAPDVDGVTFVYAEELDIGSVVAVRITDAFEHDLAGEPDDES